MSRVLKRVAATAAAALIIVAAGAPVVAVGWKTWTTSAPSNSFSTATKSADGCTAKGVANNASGYASTYWTDSTANSGYDCAVVRARAYVYAGTESYWTSWDKDEVNAYVRAPGIVSGQHELFTE